MKKGMTLITAVLGAVALFLGALTVTNSIKSNKEFISDGYILDPSKDEAIVEGMNTQYYFSKGGKYKEKFGTNILFKDQNGDDAKLSMDHFVHYNDGSLGAFTKGVLLDVSDLDQSNYGYYSLTKNTILVKSGNSYELSSKGEALALTEYMWKISDTDYMLIAPTVTLTVGNQTMDFEDYAQISYVDNGIVRISHVTGTYQTISAESTLTTTNGAELNLVGKNFALGDGSELSLNDLALNDDSYIKADENVEDQIKIPTFNVINGKDGSNGTNGESGESGESGEQGTEGQQGTEGTAGSQGSEGAQGSEGSQGSDGSDGTMGTDGGMGYDGASGKNGKNAENAASASSVASADLNLRPTVTMDAGTNGADYKVTSTTASMMMKLEDVDDALGDDTKVYVYNKRTMQQVNSDAEAASWGSSLANNPGGTTLNMSGLDPDTEYMIVVKSSYFADKNNLLENSTLFTKSFSTSGVGVDISRLLVTENSIAASIRVTDDNVNAYAIEFYDSDASKTVMGTFTVNAGTNKAEDGQFTLKENNDKESIPSTAVFTAGNSTFEIVNNHQYYAKIKSVNGNTNTGDTEIPLLTLKTVPYDKATETTTKAPITSMKPTLTANNMSGTMVVSLGEIADPDSGITGYRYELYRGGETTPIAVKNSVAYAEQTFDIADKNAVYTAKVIAIFNNNESEIELSTLISETAGLAYEKRLQVVVDVTPSTEATGAKYDKLEGVVTISDPGNELIQYVTSTTPLKMIVSDAYGVEKTVQWSSFTDVASGKQAAFDIGGLRASTEHTITIYGPYDTDGDGTISDSEKLIPITSKRASTVGLYPLALAVKKGEGEQAFNEKISIVYSTKGLERANNSGLSDDAAKVNLAESSTLYEANKLKSITLQLIHVSPDGVENQLGSDKTFTQGGVDPVTETTIDLPATYITRAAATITDNTTTAPESAKMGLNAATVATGAITLTPMSFGLADQSSECYAPGYYYIRVKDAQALDVNGQAIPFDSTNKEDLVAFKVADKHVTTASTTCKVIEVTNITNKEASLSHQESGMDENTVVGLRIAPDYNRDDVDSITYTFWEVADVSTLDDTYFNSHKIYPMHSSYNSTEPFTDKVLDVTISNITGNKAEPFEIYFKDSSVTPTAGNVSVSSNGVSTAEAIANKLKRGKRYIVSYTITCSLSHLSKECSTSHGGTNVYPYCIYKGNSTEAAINQTPLYRSKLITLNRQVPVVERYLYDTPMPTKARWIYRIVDPDGAIIIDSDAGNKKITLDIKTYDNLTDVSKTGTGSGYIPVPSEGISALNSWSTEESRFTDIILTSSGKYYTTAINYRKTDAGQTEQIESKKVLMPATSTPSDNIMVKGHDGHAGIESEAGYRYIVTLEGNNLAKIAAARVTFSGTNDVGSIYKVVYDPVDVMKNSTEINGSTKTTQLYLDTSPLTYLTTNGVTEVDVTVEGYYANGQMGFKDFTAKKTFTSSDKRYDSKYSDRVSLGDENVYAVRITNGMTDTYKYYSGGSLINTNEDIRGSFFVPGTNTLATGFTVSSTGNEGSVANLTTRYPSSPLSVSDARLQDNSVASGSMSNAYAYTKSDISLDETGVKLGTDYYNVEQLSIVEIPFNNTGESHVKLSDLFPAVSLTSTPGISRGANSAVITMNVVGPAASIGGRIYAKVFKGDDELYVKGETGDQGRSLSVSETETGGYSKSSTGGPNPTTGVYDGNTTAKDNNYIEIESDGDGGFKAVLRLKGLKPTTTYKVVFYAYDGKQIVRELFSTDAPNGGRSNYPYSFITRDKINISVTPRYELISYNDKNLYFDFAVDGYDTSGYDIYIRPQGSTSESDWKLVPKYNSSTYYPTKASGATVSPTAYTINPGSWLYNMEHKYEIKARSSDGDISVSPSTVTASVASSNPEITITNTSSNTSGSDTTLGFTTTFVDDKKIIKNYKISISGNGSIGTSEYSEKAVSDSVTNFSITNAVGTYTITVIATCDPNNDNSTFTTVTKQLVYTLSSAASSDTVYVSPSTSNNVVTLQLSGVKQFDSVNRILLTIVKYSDKISVASSDKNLSVSITNGSDYSDDFTLDHSLVAGTKYEARTQYYYGEQILGNDSYVFVYNPGE